jgi:uncharacterized protein (DUF3820 family)
MAKRSYEDRPLSFGKFRGKLICDIPSGYLTWLSEQDFFSRDFPALFDLVEQELLYRDRWVEHFYEERK